MIALSPSVVRAEPTMAFRGGFKCGQCHVNRTGGGKRNDFGVIYSKTTLPIWKFPSAKLVEKMKNSLGSKTSKDPRESFLGKIGEHISLGGNLRLGNNTTFRGGGARTNNFAINEGNLYLEANLFGELLTFYVDTTLVNTGGGVANREAFALVRGLPLNMYVKAGRFMLPYGIRLFDDTAFTRNRTGFTYAMQDLGVEVGIEPGPFSWIVAVTNGDAGNKQKQITTRGEFVSRHARAGGSFSWNDGSTTTSFRYGPFVGAHYGKFTLLGEWTIIKDQVAGATTTQWAILSEINYLILKGLNLKANYQFLDPNRSVANDFRSRVVTGLEVFPTQFSQVSAFFRWNNGIPQLPAQNDEELFVELHLFF